MKIENFKLAFPLAGSVKSSATLTRAFRDAQFAIFILQFSIFNGLCS